MLDLLNAEISKSEQEEIKEFVLTLLLLSPKDRVILLSNANTLKTRRDLEKAEREKKKIGVNNITKEEK